MRLCSALITAFAILASIAVAAPAVNDPTIPARSGSAFSDDNWISMGGFPGANGEVRTAVLDDSGNLYIAGGFTIIGDVLADGIARWNGEEWSALGSGFSGFYVSALAVFGGDLYAGGEFWDAERDVAYGLAKWDGTEWSALASGIRGSVFALTVSGGDLYVAGEITRAGGVPANNIAKWDGNKWAALGPGIGDSVWALAASDGDLYAARVFTLPGSGFLPSIASDRVWVGPSLEIWVVTPRNPLDWSSVSLTRLHPDGTLDQKSAGPAFLQVEGHMSPQFDALRRGYFLFTNTDEFGSGNRQSIVRFLPDGTVDPSFEVILNGHLRNFSVAGDGSILVLLVPAGADSYRPEVIEFRADGTQVTLFRDDGWGRLVQAERTSDGRVLLTKVHCASAVFWTICSTGLLYLDESGGLSLHDGTILRDREIVWRSGFDFSADRIISSRSISPDQSDNRSIAGFPFNGLFVLESDVKIPLHRAGGTALPAVVEVSVIPASGSGPHQAAAHKAQVHFPMGTAEGVLELDGLHLPGYQPLREFIIRIDSAQGAALTELTTCRLWVVDSDVLPEPCGGMRLETFPSPENRFSALLLARWPEHYSGHLEVKKEISLPWRISAMNPRYSWDALGSLYLIPFWTASQPELWFRLRLAHSWSPLPPDAPCR